MIKYFYFLPMFIAFLTVEAQAIKKSKVIGNYQNSIGDPARTVKQSDGSAQSIGYLEYERTNLQVKHFGRLKIKNYQQNTLLNTSKGRWQLKNDTLIISYNGSIFTYRFKEPVYLISLDGQRSFNKQTN